VRSWLTGFLVALTSFLLMGFVFGWRNRSRPYLEITDGEIRFSPGVWRPVSFSATTIVSVWFWGERLAVIRHRAGRPLFVQLWRIGPSERKRAVAALNRAARMGAGAS